MKAEFTEFSYGYAVVDNMRRSGLGGFTTAPIFPTLIAEGAPGGGYDLAVPLNGIPMLLQFKVPEVLVRRSRRLPAGYAPPYYRMHLRPSRHSKQHELLIEHEQAGRAVFYVSPQFHTNTDLDVHFLADQVWHRSLRIRPLQIGPLPDDKDHCVAYDGGTSAPVFQSKSFTLNGSFDDAEVERYFDQIVPTRISKEQTLQRFNELFTDLIQLAAKRDVRQSVGASADELKRLNPIRGAAYTARVFLDCELFVVGRRRRPPSSA